MISRFCIQRPIFAIVLSLVIIIAGLGAMLNLPIAQYPEISPPQVTVSTSYPGADADTIAQAVAAPIETQVNGVDNMLYIESSCSSAGPDSLSFSFSGCTDSENMHVQVTHRRNLKILSCGRIRMAWRSYGSKTSVAPKWVSGTIFCARN